MTVPRRTAAPGIAVRIEDPMWRAQGPQLLADLRRAMRRALADAPAGPGRGRSLTLLLADDARLKALNAQFRGKNKPTNVLSFPSGDCDYLGDVAIAYGVTAREAADAGKPFRNHALHLAVHGVLHLLGYDHETAREARIMEPLETAILAKLDIDDPYAPGRRAAE